MGGKQGGKAHSFAHYWKEESPLIFRVKGSVIKKIWPQVVLGISNSILVVCIHYYMIEFPEFPPSFITVLGLVIGLLLVFRTSTGYDRYWEGRKLWSTVTFRIRMMSYSVWLGIKESPATKTEDMIEKRSAINLLIAFAYALKNYLREEYSHNADDDIKELIPHLSRITQPQQVELDTFSEEDTSRKNGFMATVRMKLPIDSQLRSSKGNIKKRCREHVTMSTRRRLAAEKNNTTTDSTQNRDSVYHAHDHVAPTNIPLELVCHFLSYLYKVTDEKKIDPETGKSLLSSANELTNCLTQLERILRTPIPMAYSIHLHQCIWLYILFLPCQVVAKIGWFTIPGMCLACTYLLGILAIGWEIENPFGYDDNDLPLDDFCDVVREEVERLIKSPFPETESWMFSRKNRPFEPDTNLSAKDLRTLSFEELQKVISGNSNPILTIPSPSCGPKLEYTISESHNSKKNEDSTTNAGDKQGNGNFGFDAETEQGIDDSKIKHPIN